MTLYAVRPHLALQLEQGDALQLEVQFSGGRAGFIGGVAPVPVGQFVDDGQLVVNVDDAMVGRVGPCATVYVVRGAAVVAVVTAAVSPIPPN